MTARPLWCRLVGVMLVTTLPIHAEPVRADWPAVLVPQQSQVLATKADGAIAAVYFQLGDTVTAGQLLVQMDSGALQRELAEASANLQESLTEQQRQSLLARKAGQEYQRRQRAGQAVSDEQLAASSYEAEASQVVVESAKHRVQRERAKLAQLQLKQQETELRAPFSGVITSLPPRVGSRISVGTELVKLVSTQQLLLRFAIVDEQHHVPAVGNHVLFHRDGQPTVALPAVVTRVAPELDDVSQSRFIEAQPLEAPTADWLGADLRVRAP